MSNQNLNSNHSITHAASLIAQTGEEESASVPAVNADAAAMNSTGANNVFSTSQPSTFQKIRRRLTITGASDTIDGVNRLSVSGKRNSIETAANITLANDSNNSSNANANGPNNTLPCAVHKYAGMSKKGHAPYNPRKENQDALIMVDDPATNTLILCTLDGHGEHGDAVAQAFRDSLATQMMNHPKWKVDVKQAAADCIHAIESSVIRNFRVDTEFSGTTLSMAIVRGNWITGVNIGDSRVIIGKVHSDDGAATAATAAGTGTGTTNSSINTGNAQIHQTQQSSSNNNNSNSNSNSNSNNISIIEEEFTHDHKPDTPAEKQRILEAGGRVFAVEYDDGIDGPPRVWLGHMDVPGLAMSRSLGDCVAHTAGVSSEPDFTERQLTPNDKFIVVATDGLWEFISNKETVDMVQGMDDPTSAVRVLVKEANTRWMKEEQVIDDTTVIAAFLYDYKP